MNSNYMKMTSVVIFTIYLLGCTPKIQENQLFFINSPGISNCELIPDLPLENTTNLLLTLTKIEIPKEFETIKWNIYGPLACGSEITFIARQKLIIVDGRIPTAFGSDFVAVLQPDETFKVKFGL